MGFFNKFKVLNVWKANVLSKHFRALANVVLGEKLDLKVLTGIYGMYQAYYNSISDLNWFFVQQSFSPPIDVVSMLH